MNHFYSSTPIEVIRCFDDRQDATCAIRMLTAAMRSRHHDRPYHRVSMAHVVRARVTFYTGANGQRPLSIHDVI